MNVKELKTKIRNLPDNLEVFIIKKEYPLTLELENITIDEEGEIVEID